MEYSLWTLPSAELFPSSFISMIVSNNDSLTPQLEYTAGYYYFNYISLEMMTPCN